MAVTLLSGCGDTSAPRGDNSPSAEYSVSLGSESPPATRNWPGFRGLGAHAVVDGAQLPLKWRVETIGGWKAEIPGRGNSSPVVWEDKVLLTSVLSQDESAAQALHCFDRKSGQLLWTRRAATVRGRTHRMNGYASATPVTDGEVVVAYFGSAGLFAFDLEGRRLWKADLGRVTHPWGTASSPLLFGSLVIQLCDHDGDSFIAGYELSSGREVWRTARQSSGCWATPIVITADRADGARRHELIVNGTGSVAGDPGWMIAYDPASGRELWRCRGTADIPVPTAIWGDGVLVSSSSSGGSGRIFAVQPGGSGDVTDTHVLWRQDGRAPDVSTGVIYGGRLFTVDQRGWATCRDVRSGREIWSHRIGGRFVASPLAGDNRIYAVDQRGDVIVFAADTDDFAPLATSRLYDLVRATPAVAQGQLFVRTGRQLLCMDASKSAESSEEGEDGGRRHTLAKPPLDDSDIRSPSSLSGAEEADDDAR